MKRENRGKGGSAGGRRLVVFDPALVFVTVAVAGVLWAAGGMFSAASASEDEVNCDAHSGACTQHLGDLAVTLEIAPRPVTAMQDLVFKVAIAGAEPSAPPYIDLGMPAMKMGPNRVRLEQTGPGSYEGRGVIVKCPSGRRTWFANVVIPASGEVKFVFDVVY